MSRNAPGSSVADYFLTGDPRLRERRLELIVATCSPQPTQVDLSVRHAERLRHGVTLCGSAQKARADAQRLTCQNCRSLPCLPTWFRVNRRLRGCRCVMPAKCRALRQSRSRRRLLDTALGTGSDVRQRVGEFALGTDAQEPVRKPAASVVMGSERIRAFALLRDSIRWDTPRHCRRWPRCSGADAFGRHRRRIRAGSHRRAP